ncbi:MHS family MFS transporter [Gluconacetobacter azotocaptans]|uniref:MHS family MFS transporter n=1 Tax=Gluconacetobacter azotocaptans TaxID=142834 RepID=A0A7W4JQ77_9PROT|nr:MFS transporter [Gluconacetobacter azotocaptans]MBB2188782.1 MHS family MFS transporter [Gluconacetobacter azotocaptans]GBQ31030.1 major facilitator superfamily transporter [Gluconacetobacter azotocaptans DSM 13594]
MNDLTMSRGAGIGAPPLSDAGAEAQRMAQAPDARQQRRRASIGSLIGTTIEWYEYYIYGATAALVFPHLFFPSHNRLVSLMLSFASFGVAFLIRPIGAAVFGHFGDRVGRKTTLIVTLTLSGLATFLIGVLPSYDRIGLWAPALLVTLRVVQGFGVGGEWGGAALMSLEWGEQNRRGAAGAWPQVGTSIGLILSTSAVMGASLLTGPDFLVGGWRIPFLLSGVLVVIGLLVRLSIRETPSFARALQEKRIEASPVGTVLRGYWREIIMIAFLRMSEQMPFYIFTAFIFDYATTTAHVTRTFVLSATLVAAVIDMILLPVCAVAADRIGRRRMYYIGCAVLVLMAFPYFRVLNSGNTTLIFVAIALSLLPHALQYGAQASLISEQFPVNIRYSGAGLGYQMSSLVAGGPAPLVAAALLAWSGSGYAVAAYLVFGGVVAAVALSLMTDRSKAAM